MTDSVAWCTSAILHERDDVCKTIELNITLIKHHRQ